MSLEFGSSAGRLDKALASLQEQERQEKLGKQMVAEIQSDTAEQARALVFTGGAVKLSGALGAAKVLEDMGLGLSEDVESLEKQSPYKLVYGGSGGAIIAAAFVSGQMGKLTEAFRDVEHKRFFDLRELLKWKNALKIDDLLNFYRNEVNFDAQKALDSPIGLVISVQNYDTGEVVRFMNESAYNLAGGVGEDNTAGGEVCKIQDVEHFWRVIEAAQTMPGFSSVNPVDLIPGRNAQRFADSYNAAAFVPAMQHAASVEEVSAVDGINTSLRGHHERDLAAVSALFGLGVNGGRYAEERSRRRKFETLKGDLPSYIYNNKKINILPLDPGLFPYQAIGKPGNAGDNIAHGEGVAKSWFPKAGE